MVPIIFTLFPLSNVYADTAPKVEASQDVDAEESLGSQSGEASPAAEEEAEVASKPDQPSPKDSEEGDDMAMCDNGDESGECHLCTGSQ